jgi:hypothetical protein
MHSTTPHQKLFLWLGAFAFIIATAVGAEPVADRNGPMNPDLLFMNSLDSLNSQMVADQVLLAARFKLSDDQQIFEVQKTLHEMNEKLYEKQAVAEDEFRRTRSQRDQAEAQVELSKANLREAVILSMIYRLRARFSTGQKLEARRLAEAYVELWKARLDAAQSTETKSQTEWAYRSFRANMVFKLSQKDAVSRQELLESIQAEKSASLRLALDQRKVAQTRCFWQEFTKAAGEAPDPRAVAAEKCLELGG